MNWERRRNFKRRSRHDGHHPKLWKFDYHTKDAPLYMVRRFVPGALGYRFNEPTESEAERKQKRKSREFCRNAKRVGRDSLCILNKVRVMVSYDPS